MSDSERSSTTAAVATVAGIVVADQLTKLWAERALLPRHTPHDVVGEVVRFTLTYNPGAAFGMHLGDASRWIFMVLTVLIVGFLVRLYRSLPAAERALRLAIAAVIGGAIGNFIDRIRSPEGVVDFIDIGVGDVRFWTFNIADMAVSVGAACLVLLLWRFESKLQHAQPAGEAGAAER
ncbi:signal peptidase II [Roseisolibacter sp. H3M3-2]|uniref:signal peptidase II n=1 Tax=Roseisolibacter sp. H3M3-2 TaxID=3031323 RepID=UPI0023DA15F1|nr:signal peptidase II [Roseisolibacter sp. H3M3-2]MDF1504404.1 signal peptidase II [Roseisolibacter sp. H3M3-2]